MQKLVCFRNEMNRIQNNRHSWIHLVDRMEPERSLEQLMGYTLIGTRSVGRPKIRWTKL
jgi:hypothetical protein